MGTIDQVTLKKKKKKRERHFEKKGKKKKQREKRTWEGHLWKSFSLQVFLQIWEEKKMWAQRENFSSSFPTFLFSFSKRTVENSIFHHIFHPLYFHPKQTEPKGLFGYRLLLKTESQKNYSKIIFKCVNSAVGPSFKVIFAEFHTCESCEQCTKRTKKNADAQSNANVLLSKPSLILTSKYNFASCALASLLALIQTLICSISLIK